jgi:tryptophan 2,3-dioxygenase
MANHPPISYRDYLKIETLLEIQKPRSNEFGHPAHDEMLFIITHQTYELWFKQILTEIDFVLASFGSEKVDEAIMGQAVSKLHRVIAILRLLVDQVSVLETMTSMEFLEFRNYLYPASGFQSVQWRLIENKLGLARETRLTYNSLPYTAFVSEPERDVLLASESQASLFQLVDTWLARTPFLQTEGFNFKVELKNAVDDMFTEDRDKVLGNTLLSDDERKKNIAAVEGMKQTFASLLEPEAFEKLRVDGIFRMSYGAIHAALFINLYRDEPILHMPFQLLTALQDIDELMTTWRYRHSLMAHRMIGMKVGTGGSTGAKYLKGATEGHRIFTDLFNLSTYLIPKSKRPVLPEGLRLKMRFN